MSKIKLTLPDGKKLQLENGKTCLDAAKLIGAGLAKAALAAKLDGVLVDLDFKPEKDATFQILTFKDEEGKKVFWHTTTHIMAAAVLKLYPKAKLSIGPPIADGFYYDIDMETLQPEAFVKIEQEMKKIVDSNLSCSHEVISVADAKKRFKDNWYKVEILDEIKQQGEKTVTLYHLGDTFTDLCRGPHIPNTGMIQAFKILRSAGAYWRGDAKNKQLQRLYGLSFPEKKELEAHLKLIEEAEKRDHRKIGKELDLFSGHVLSPGSTFFHPKGMIIYMELMNFLREQYKKRDYKEVLTPIIYNKQLWETSGHWEHYQQHMFKTESEGQTFAIKPMNCPGHAIIYKSETRSYRDLPLRLAEFGQLHRNELSGTLTGLTRVRRFVTDDCHIFCTPEQIQKEVEDNIEFAEFVFKKTFGFEYHIELSTKPEKSIGAVELWKEAEEALQKALEKNKIKYKLNPGDGAFYGPKIDFHIKDALGRTWQCATIQIDFNMPERFDLNYEGQDGKKHRPVMVHRAILGSIERFMGVLIEHYAGKFPLWLNPNQVMIISISDKFNDYAEKVKNELRDHNIRVELDDKTETVNKKVREAQLQQFNYILVVGEKEEKDNTINVRTRDNIIHGEQKLDAFTKRLHLEIQERR